MRCPRCDERLDRIVKEAMGEELVCKACRVRVEIPYGDVLKGNKLDRIQEEK